jgi:hypothetical protein
MYSYAYSRRVAVSRFLRTLIIIVPLLLSTSVIFAQNEPSPPVATEETGPPITDETQNTAPVVPPDEVATTEDQGEETQAEPAIVPALPTDGSVEITLSARQDLELLAGALFPGSRPEGWNGGVDINDPDLAIKARIDLEILAGNLLGNTRPPNWFGVVPSTAYAVARDIRHDLELLVDTAGVERPAGWAGDNPLLNCDRTTQAIIRFFELNIADIFVLQADRTSPDFCKQASLEAALFMEVNYLANPNADGSRLAPGFQSEDNSAATISSDFAVGFYDRNAIQRAGIIPNGTAIRPVARSYADFSNMMVVSGDGFLVFIDYNFTSVTEDQFEALSNVDDITDFAPGCDADWC